MSPGCLVQEQPEQQQQQQEEHQPTCRYTGQYDLNVRTAVGWELWEFGSAVGKKYIVFIWAHHPISSVNKEGIPLSLLPTTKKKGRGAELVGGEVK